MVKETKFLYTMDSLIYMSKSDRIKCFLELLKTKESRWSNAFETHLHLHVCFYENEIEYFDPDSKIMSFPVFSNFTFLDKFNLYRWKTNSHIIFIHNNGAYGIYYLRTVSKHENAITLYKEKTPLVKVTSISGEDLW